jgi:hypothetical protein
MSMLLIPPLSSQTPHGPSHYLLCTILCSLALPTELHLPPPRRRIIRGIECIVVDRAASGSHDGVFDAIKRRAKGEGGMRTQVVIFPEGEAEGLGGSGSSLPGIDLPQYRCCWGSSPSPQAKGYPEHTCVKGLGYLRAVSGWRIVLCVDAVAVCE